MDVYRYYTIMRPPMPGAQPRGIINITEFESRMLVPEIGRTAWGFVEYERPITEKELMEYELVESPANPTEKK